MAPYVLAFNKSVNDERQQLIAKAFDRPDEDASVIAHEFISSLDMPRTLRDVGIKTENFQRIAEVTMLDFWARTNPRPINSIDEVIGILKSAY